ncbi:TPA: ribokinase [Salmonella enterica]|nr:ribokinase [Salmonella enterica]
MKSDVVVIGSLNYDILIQQDRLPEVGETFTGNELMLMPGGKGANQAVQCSKLGLNVSMVGCVGNDIYGEHLINALHENNVSVTNVLKRGTTTGIGIVQILESGDYCSTIIKGANYLLNENDISDNLFDGKPLVILQSEIPSHVVDYVIKAASTHQCKIILNNAPARSIAPSTLSSVDYLVVNETEASFMAGSDVSSIDDAHFCAAKLHKMVRSNVIITLGEKGAVLSSDESTRHFPAAFCPEVIDTTGAGDSFIGGIAYCLVNNIPLTKATPFAAEISMCSIQKYGGQSSFPMLADVAHALDYSDL